MKWILPLSLLSTMATAMPAIGNAESWCIRDSAGITSEICAFSSADDCTHAALLGPSGGIVCAPERGHGAKSSKRLGNAAAHGSRQKRTKRVLVGREEFGFRAGLN